MKRLIKEVRFYAVWYAILCAIGYYYGGVKLWVL